MQIGSMYSGVKSQIWQSMNKNSFTNSMCMQLLGKFQQQAPSSTDINAVDGPGVNVFWLEDSTAENPKAVVKVTNADGSHFEVEVNFNDINPRNASLVEIVALHAYREANGMPRRNLDIAWIRSIDKFSVENSELKLDFLGKSDFLSPMIDAMESARFNGNWEMHMRLREMVDFLNQFPRSG